MIQWTSLATAAIIGVGAVFFFRAWRRAPVAPFPEQTWRAEWQRQRLAIYAYACLVFAALALADFIGLFD